MCDNLGPAQNSTYNSQQHIGFTIPPIEVIYVWSSLKIRKNFDFSPIIKIVHTFLTCKTDLKRCVFLSIYAQEISETNFDFNPDILYARFYLQHLGFGDVRPRKRAAPEQRPPLVHQCSEAK